MKKILLLVVGLTVAMSNLSFAQVPNNPGIVPVVNTAGTGLSSSIIYGKQKFVGFGTKTPTRGIDLSWPAPNDFNLATYSVYNDSISTYEMRALADAPYGSTSRTSIARMRLYGASNVSNLSNELVFSGAGQTGGMTFTPNEDYPYYLGHIRFRFAGNTVFEATNSNIYINAPETFAGQSTPPTPAVGTTVEWFDGVYKRYMKNVGGVIAGGVIY